jgi:hypothetical protein
MRVRTHITLNKDILEKTSEEWPEDENHKRVVHDPVLELVECVDAKQADEIRTFVRNLQPKVKVSTQPYSEHYTDVETGVTHRVFIDVDKRDAYHLRQRIVNKFKGSFISDDPDRNRILLVSFTLIQK